MNNNTGNPLSKNDSDEARTMARVGSATLRVERETRENYNVTLPAAVGPHHYTPTKMMVARVTGDLSPGNGLHTAKLYYLDSSPQLNEPPDPIVWVEVVPDEDTGDFAIKPQPSQTLSIGDQGVAMLVGVLGGTTVYTISGPGTTDPGSCLRGLRSQRVTDCITGQVLGGSGDCANIVAQTFKGGSIDGEIWVGDDPIPTPLGDAIFREYRTARPPRATLTIQGEGSGPDRVFEGTYVRCLDGRREYEFSDPLLCTTNTATGAVADCAGCPPPTGTVESFSFLATGGTGDYEVANGPWIVTHVAGCEWAVTNGDVTWSLTNESGVAHLVGPADISFVGPFVCCGPMILAFDTGSGTGTPPTLSELVAVVPCAPPQCDTNSFAIRVGCAGSCGIPVTCLNVNLPRRICIDYTVYGISDSHELVYGARFDDISGTCVFPVLGGWAGITPNSPGHYRQVSLYEGPNVSDGNSCLVLAFSHNEFTPTGGTCYTASVVPDIELDPDTPLPFSGSGTVAFAGGTSPVTYTLRDCSSSPPPPPPPPPGPPSPPPVPGECCTDVGEVFASSEPNMTGTGIIPSISFVVPSGASGYWEGTQAGAANTYWYLNCTADVWTLVRYVDGVQSGPVTATSANCATGVFLFDGTAFGVIDTGFGNDITVSV